MGIVCFLITYIYIGRFVCVASNKCSNEVSERTMVLLYSKLLTDNINVLKKLAKEQGLVWLLNY